ncbi:MAG: hypothetical protein HYU64_16590 [Armatimonadetes bacterium]|nr:hypothetical protein [Armatimonadota bacterium]
MSEIVCLSLDQHNVEFAQLKKVKDKYYLEFLETGSSEAPLFSGGKLNKEAIQDLLKERGIGAGQRISIALPDKEIIIREAVLPAAAGKDISGGIGFAIRKELPVEPSKAVVNYFLTGKAPDRRLNILAGQRDFIEDIKSTFTSLGLKVERITMKSPTTVTAMAAPRGKPCAVLDLTSGGLNFTVIQDGIPLFNSTFSGIPADMTSYAPSMGETDEERIQILLNRWAVELFRSIKAFESQHKKFFDEVYLTGYWEKLGNAERLEAFFREKLDLQARIASFPDGEILYDSQRFTKQALDQQARVGASVLGLCLEETKEVVPGTVLDFSSDWLDKTPKTTRLKMSARPDAPPRKPFPVALAVCIVLGALAISMALFWEKFFPPKRPPVVMNVSSAPRPAFTPDAASEAEKPAPPKTPLVEAVREIRALSFQKAWFSEIGLEGELGLYIKGETRQEHFPLLMARVLNERNYITYAFLESSERKKVGEKTVYDFVIRANLLREEGPADSSPSGMITPTPAQPELQVAGAVTPTQGAPEKEQGRLLTSLGDLALRRGVEILSFKKAGLMGPGGGPPGQGAPPGQGGPPPGQPGAGAPGQDAGGMGGVDAAAPEGAFSAEMSIAGDLSGVLQWLADLETMRKWVKFEKLVLTNPFAEVLAGQQGNQPGQGNQPPGQAGGNQPMFGPPPQQGQQAPVGQGAPPPALLKQMGAQPGGGLQGGQNAPQAGPAPQADPKKAPPVLEYGINEVKAVMSFQIDPTIGADETGKKMLAGGATQFIGIGDGLSFLSPWDREKLLPEEVEERPRKGPAKSKKVLPVDLPPELVINELPSLPAPPGQAGNIQNAANGPGNLQPNAQQGGGATRLVGVIRHGRRPLTGILRWKGTDYLVRSGESPQPHVVVEDVQPRRLVLRVGEHRWDFPLGENPTYRR